MTVRFVFILLAAVALSGCAQSIPASYTAVKEKADTSALERGEKACLARDYSTAEKYLTQAWDEADRQQIAGESQLKILKMLDSTYDHQGRYMPEAVAQRAVKLSQQIYGIGKPETLFWIDRLAEVTYKAGQKERAEKLRLDVLHAQEKLYGKDNPAVMHTIAKLVQPSCNSGACAQDEKLITRLIEMRRTYSGESSVETMHAMSLLAHLYDHKRDFAKAEPIYRDMVVIAAKAEPSTYANALNALASNLDAQNKTIEAQSVWKQALKIEDTAPRATYNQKLKTLELMSSSYEMHNRWRDAAATYKQFVSLSEQCRGKQDPEVISFRKHYQELAAKVKG